jgi:hypothetical protein
MLPIVRLAAPALLMIVAGTAPAAEDFHAGQYHEAHCMRCHDTSVYTREERRVRSYPMLEAQVARCDANLATKLFPDDLEQLTDYLNTEFYKFAK